MRVETPEIYMIEPVHVSDSLNSNSGDLDIRSKYAVKEALEQTLIDMGINPQDVVICSNEFFAAEDNLQEVNAELEELARDVADKEEKAYYDEHPDEYERDRERLRSLKFQKNDHNVRFTFDSLDSLINEYGNQNVVENGVQHSKFGVYSREAIVNIAGTDSLFDVAMTEEQLDEARVIDFIPRYMESAQLILWVLKQFIVKESLERQQLLSEGILEGAAGQDIMDWMGRIANAHGRVGSSSDLTAVLSDYGINV